MILKNDKGDSMYSILKGKVSIFSETNNLDSADQVFSNKLQLNKIFKEVHELKLGDCFGEYCLFHETVRSVSVVAKEDCILMKLEKETFLKYPKVSFLSYFKSF